MSCFDTTGTPVLDFWWRLLWVSSQSQLCLIFCLIHIEEANVIYIPSDPPLMLYVAHLLTVSIAGANQVHICPKDIISKDLLTVEEVTDNEPSKPEKKTTLFQFSDV